MASKQQTDIEQLQSQIADLQRELYRMTGRYIGPVDERQAPVQTDYIPHGSDAHAALLGLKKAGAEDEFECDGWTLEDVSQFGPSARPDYIKLILRQKVSSLKETIPATQSRDPREPHFAPKMWEPVQGGSRLTE